MQLKIGYIDKTVFILLLLLNSFIYSSVLEDAAAQMAPGEWREFQANGFGRALVHDDRAGSVLDWANEGCWDPNTREIFFIGGGHQGLCKFLNYVDATNTWKELSRPGWAPTIHLPHAYDHNAINQVDGHFYHMQGHQKVHKYTIASKSWKTLPQVPVRLKVANGLAYHPVLKGIIAVGGGTVYFFSDATQSWTRKASGLVMGGYHNIAVASPPHNMVVLGGGNGSTDVFRMDAQGNITKVKNAPFAYTVKEITTIDPVSGDYLFLGGTRDFYSYNPTTDTWKQENPPIPKFWNTADDPRGTSTIIAIPISTYGVVMFVRFKASPAIFLYKHRAPSTISTHNLNREPLNISIVPNPFRSVVNIIAQNESEIEIFDLQGRLVLQPQKSRFTWNAIFHPPGIYMVRVRINDKIHSRKIYLIR
jgi:hypothetical protein